MVSSTASLIIRPVKLTTLRTAISTGIQGYSAHNNKSECKSLGILCKQNAHPYPGRVRGVTTSLVEKSRAVKMKKIAVVGQLTDAAQPSSDEAILGCERYGDIS